MSSLTVKYYILNKEHSLNINSILNRLYIDNNNIINWCKQYDFINCNINDVLDLYPKFIDYSRFINMNINLYNQNKIMTSTSMSVEQLNSSVIDDTCLAIKNKVSKIPDNYDDLFKEFTFQNNYIRKFKDIYNKNLFIYNYKDNSYFSNFSNLLSDSYNELDRLKNITLDKHSFFHLYFLKSLMMYYFDKNNTLNNNLLNNINLLDYQIDLAAIFENNKQTLLSDIVDVILINQYNFNDVSNNFKQNILNNINITNVFQQYLQQRIVDIKYNHIQTIFDIFNHSFSFKFTDEIYQSKKYFNFIGLNSLSYNLYFISDLSELEQQQFVVNPKDYATTLNEFEQQIIQYFQLNLNSVYTLKQYFYLLYLNRNKFEKFINIIDLVFSTYVFNNIILEDIYYFNKFSHLKNLFTEWLNYIYVDKFNTKINQIYNKNIQKQFINQNNNIIKFAFIYSIYDIIEDFIQTDEFNNSILQVQKDIYYYLRNNGYIDKNIDWCSCDEPLKIYFMSFLKKLVLDDSCFDSNTILEYVLEQMDKSKYKVLSEEDFLNFSKEFIDENADKMFTFFQNITTCVNGDIFSKAVHNMFKL